MSDSDDDWFDKDIDEFVVQTQPSNVEHISVGKVADNEIAGVANVEYIDAGSLLYANIRAKAIILGAFVLNTINIHSRLWWMLYK